MSQPATTATTLTYDDVVRKVKDLLMAVLYVDDEEVTPMASLAGDLGAERLDFLEINFQLLQTFGIKVEHDLSPYAVFRGGEKGLVEDGKVTDAGLATLRDTMPHLDLYQFEKHPYLAELDTLLTVGAVCSYVTRKLEHR